MARLKHEEQLQKIFTNVNDWLKFAEAKNFGLLSLNAAIVFGFSQSNFECGSAILKAGFYVFSPFAVFSFFASLLSLFPILSSIEKGKYAKSWINKFSNWIDTEAAFENIHFYGYLKNIDTKEFEKVFLCKVNSKKEFIPYENDLATQILYNSRITWLKYQLFKIGAFFFLAGAAFFLIAIPIIKYWF
jgi:hypothetical protein